ncbi:glycosyl hydrolase family 18 protein [Acetobacterium wieringae]|uniref:glycosyl hydrolase family 18 protein n=1 Tax=Acetobacterium wieringae TaxID=52694 RepID=UPI0026ED66DE|nr:glycosyl hydrolase family 18 protein [Acetobacterium wieringae]
MNSRFYILMGTIILMPILILACNKAEINPVKAQKELTTENENNQNNNTLLAWTVYWDTEGGREELLNIEKLNEVSFFAAYFNEENQIIMPSKIEELHKQMLSDANYGERTEYLTIVNDKVFSNGSSSLKDQELLEALFQNEIVRKKHIDELISLAKSNGYEGLEIDYERIRSNDELWNLFLTFTEELWAVCEVEEIKLRIVLEPSTPFEKIAFPEGPEYVMMCYNLYGSHSEPGPKADYQFLEQLIKKMEDVPGKKSYALATGGFDWRSDDEVTALTEKQALTLLVESGKSAERDEKSGSLYFSYEDLNKVQHQIWFADATTLKGWIDVINASGEDSISIWRLGGNVSLDSL